MNSVKRLLLIGIFLTLTACSGGLSPSGSSPSGATRDPDSTSADGLPTIASSGETGNTPMPVGNVAPIPDPRCGGEGEPPCPEPLRLKAKVTLLCRNVDTGDISIQLEGGLIDPAAVPVRHIRILQEDLPVPQYTDITVKLGEDFSIDFSTDNPATLKFYDVQNWHPPLTLAREKDCPGYECIKEMGINAIKADMPRFWEAAPPCVEAADSEGTAIRTVLPGLNLNNLNKTDDCIKVPHTDDCMELPPKNDPEGPAVHAPGSTH